MRLHSLIKIVLLTVNGCLSCGKEAASEAMVYSYEHGFSGFAAKLTDSQAQKVAGNFKCNKYFFFLLVLVIRRDDEVAATNEL